MIQISTPWPDRAKDVPPDDFDVGAKVLRGSIAANVIALARCASPHNRFASEQVIDRQRRASLAIRLVEIHWY